MCVYTLSSELTFENIDQTIWKKTNWLFYINFFYRAKWGKGARGVSMIVSR